VGTVHWGPYEIFSVLSGLSLLIVALVPGKASSRLWAVLGGLFFVGYGVYVANQTTGVWTFPVWIFVIPFAAVVYLIAAIVKGRDSNGGSNDGR
jgi:hypothetical protein